MSNTLLEVFTDLSKGDITIEKASLLLDCEERLIKMRLTRWGDKLPTLLFCLQSLQDGTVTAEAVADELQVSKRDVYQLTEKWNITLPERPEGEYSKRRKSAATKWTRIIKAAISVIAGDDLESAAIQAEVSERQLRRWVDKLLKEYHGIVWKDMNMLPLPRRRELARSIEENQQDHQKGDANDRRERSQAVQSE